MKSFPMFIRTTGRRIVIAGGGEQAAQKARLVLKSDAEIILAAPQLDAELQGLVAQGRAAHHTGWITLMTLGAARFALWQRAAQARMPHFMRLPRRQMRP